MRITNLWMRIITALWLGLLGYFFIFSQTLFFAHIHTPLFTASEIIVPIVFILIGFLWGYKILLLPSDDLYRFPLRCVAGVWAGTALYMLFKIFTTLDNVIFFIPGFILGWLVLYKILLYPQVKYLKQFPNQFERIFSAVFIGSASILIVWHFFQLRLGILNYFIFLLSAYLGYFYAYRVLLLPTSFKGFLKSLSLGIIGVSYALIVVYFIFVVGFLFAFIYTHNIGFNLKAFIEVNFYTLFFVFPLAGISLCICGAVLNSILFLISRVWVGRHGY